MLTVRATEIFTTREHTVGRRAYRCLEMRWEICDTAEARQTFACKKVHDRRMQLRYIKTKFTVPTWFVAKVGVRQRSPDFRQRKRSLQKKANPVGGPSRPFEAVRVVQRERSPENEVDPSIPPDLKGPADNGKDLISFLLAIPITAVRLGEKKMSAAERRAPELRVQKWIGEDGRSMIAPLKLSDLGPGPKILFAFQHWCPGCHSHGFPTLRRLYGALRSKGVGFAVIQTVFEGVHENTFEKLRINQLEYELPVAFGHDELPEGALLSTFMEDYRTRGTPWFTVIDAEGRIVFSDFQLDAEWLVNALEQA